MTKPTQPPLIDRLKIFYEELIEYRKLEGNRLSLTGEEHKRHRFLREKLLREAQIFKGKIIELTNLHHIEIKGKTYDIWVEAFDDNLFSAAEWPSIKQCIDSTNIAIGKLESIEISKLGSSPNLSTPQEIASYLFDGMQFHPKVTEASMSCFQSGLYREAILNSFISLIDYVKEKTGSEDEGKSLMAHVFDEINPLIRLNSLRTKAEKDEQEGFKFLFMGATVGIRNPKAHTIIPQSDPLKTLEYLAFASLLMRRIEEGTATKIRRPREYWNQEKFLVDTEKRCGRERVNVIKKLIDFTIKNSEGGIRWGQGKTYGTFAFRKLIRGIPVSVFLVYSDGTFFLNFGPLKNSGVNVNILESFRMNLNRIPNVKLNNILVIEDNKYGSLGLRSLENTQNFEIFESAVLSLCQQIDSSLKEENVR